ncbi:MAG: hypothetical protein EOO27_47885 [Comamonadaceae bacterium]|nr:MAG: hypothetical protein EOO27_47885 [Comamonadaceae bacterium]
MSEIALALVRMNPIIGTTDEYGVTVTARDRDGYAEVTLKIPSALPEEFRDRLAPLAVQRVLFTRADAEAAHSLTADWDRDQSFMVAVRRAADIARQAVKDAVFAHARGHAWPRL